MDWIKKNPHLLALGVLSLLLAATSVYLILQTKSFGETFAKVESQVVPGNKLPPLDLAPIEEAESRLSTPAKWSGAALFVPDQYVISKTTNRPEKVIASSFWRHSRTGQEIPNKWFEDHGLHVADPNVTLQDQDKDGFSNEDEWLAGTDPNKAESHPPYYTELFFLQYIRVPFRLKFQAYDGDKAQPDKMEYQINGLDRKTGTLFLKLGDKVGNSPFQIKSFEYKTRINPSTNEEEDVSELTVTNTETQESVVLPITKIVDSPDSYANFVYEWHLATAPKGPHSTFQVKKLGKFALPPEKDKFYKLLDINDKEAVIETPTGERVTISRDPRLK